MNIVKADAARLRITLPELDPTPWREVVVPLSMTFTGLHDTIQAAFQWFDCHLWEFNVEDRCYGIPFNEDPTEHKIYKADTTRLVKLRDNDIKKFMYIYDMGDYWEHHIEVIELFDADVGSRLPVFLNGEWRTPPEDVGGTMGFKDFLEVMQDPNHEEHQDVIDWYDGLFDPTDIDLEIVKIHMKRLASMRRPKK